MSRTGIQNIYASRGVAGRVYVSVKRGGIQHHLGTYPDIVAAREVVNQIPPPAPRHGVRDARSGQFVRQERG